MYDKIISITFQNTNYMTNPQTKNYHLLSKYYLNLALIVFDIMFSVLEPVLILACTQSRL